MTVERSDNFTDKGIRDRYEHDGREEMSKRVVEHLYDTHLVSVSGPVLNSDLILQSSFVLLLTHSITSDYHTVS